MSLAAHFLILAAVILFAIPSHSVTSTSSDGITYQGRILKPDNTPLSGSSADFVLQIRSNDSANCLLYQETRSGVDMSQANGTFSFTINDGNGTRNTSVDSGLSITRIFANQGTNPIVAGRCSGAPAATTWSPGASDARILSVQFKDETMSGFETIPAVKINSAPFALSAAQVAGFPSSAIVRVAELDGTLGNVMPLKAAEYANLLSLAQNASSTYTSYGTLNGRNIPAIMGTNQVLGWDGTNWVSVPVASGAGSVDSTMIAAGAVGTTQLSSTLAINTSGNLVTSGALQAGTTLTVPQIYGSNAASGNIKIDGTPDATKGNVFLASAGGSVGIGTTSPNAKLYVFGGQIASETDDAANLWYLDNRSSTASRRVGIIMANYDGAGFSSQPEFDLRSLRGSQSAVLPTQAGDGLGLIQFQSGMTGSVKTGATISAVATQAASGTAAGGSLKFATTPNNTIVPVERLRIDQGGAIGIGTTAPGANALDVEATLTQTAVGYYQGVLNQTSVAPTSASGATGYIGTLNVTTTSSSNVTNGSINATTANAGVYTGGTGQIEVVSALNANAQDYSDGRTVNNLIAGNFYIQTSSTTGVINNAYGVSAQMQNTGTTIYNGYGVWTGPIYGQKKWSMYASDATAPSYFAGKVGVGTTAPTAFINVAAGTSAAGTSPLKFTPGALLSTPEDGAFEYAGTNLYYTIGSTRYAIPMSAAVGNLSNVTSINNTASISINPVAGGSVSITGGTPSNDSTSGALVVTGGEGVSGALNVGSNITSGGAVTSLSVVSPQIYGSTLASGNIKIDGTSNLTKGNVLLASAGGNVGIGTTSPVDFLQINNTAAGPSRLRLTNATTGASASNGFWLGVDSGGDSYVWEQQGNPIHIATNGTERMTILGAGNVGIGTTAPTEKLSVVGGNIQVSNNQSFRVQNAAASGVAGELLASAADATYLNSYTNGLNLRTLSVSPVTIGINGTERFRVDTNGNVGIGTTAPASQLHLYKTNTTDGQIQIESNGSTSTYGIDLYSNSVRRGFVGLRSSGSSAPTPAMNYSFYLWADFFGSPMIFGTANNERLRIDGSGNVGIGTTSPGAKLDVAGAMRLEGATSGYAGFQAPASMATSTVWTLPSADGTGGYLLSTNGAGLLSWVPPSGGGSGFNTYNTYTYCFGHWSCGVGSPGANANENVVIGDGALYNLPASASNNVAIGASAGGGNLAAIGNSNALVGVNAGYQLGGSSSYNVAMGPNALASATTSTDVVAIGDYAGSGGGGNSSIMVGHYAGSSATGSYNVFVGDYTFFSNSAAWTGSNNVIVGSKAVGANGGGSAAQNVVVGSNSGNSLGNNSNDILLGYNIDVAGSNYMSLGNLIFGKWTSAGTGTTPATGGMVGIGTTSPLATLEVNGFAKLKVNSAQPVACSPTQAGSIAVTSQSTICVCNGSSSTWVKSSDGSTTCLW